jgi:ankyrin repeat protein
MIESTGTGNTRTVMKRLLDRRVDLARVVNDRNPLLEAAENGATALVALFLGSGASPNVMNSEKLSALMLACTNGHVETTRLLIDGGACVNCYSEVKTTALMAASYNGHHHCVLLLLRAKAHVSAAGP